jgi:hypothetical protein
VISSLKTIAPQRSYGSRAACDTIKHFVATQAGSYKPRHPPNLSADLIEICGRFEPILLLVLIQHYRLPA